MAAPDFQSSHVTAVNLHLTSHGIAGACEGSLACSTCHVVVEVCLLHSCLQLAAYGVWSHHLIRAKPIAHPVLLARDLRSLDYGPSCWRIGMWLQDQEKFDILPEADDDENDMLDLAFALTDT